MNSSPETEVVTTLQAVSPTQVDRPMVHDGIWSPVEMIAHCERMREEIAERQKHLIDIPV